MRHSIPSVKQGSRSSMTALQPYPIYKDSGIDWLGEVPEHWEVRWLGTFGRFFKGSGGTKADETDEGVPCVRYGDLYTRHQFHITESKACVAPHRAGAYTPVRYGDVLFAGSGETLDEIGKSAVNLIRRSAVCGGDVIVFRPTIDVDAEFIGWSTDCRQAAFHKARMGRGMTVMHIYSSDLKRLAVPLPPLPEQTAIARFLAHADRRIRRYIRAKEGLAKLLEEQKQTIIHQAITGQIDVRTGQPYPAYKDSGVEWLREVPKHWCERPLKRVARIDNSGSYGEEPLGSECVLPVATTAQIDRDGQFSVGDMPQRGFSVEDAKKYRCEVGDILIVKSSGSIFNVVSGKAGIVDEECPEFAFSNFLLRVVADRQVISPHLLYGVLSGRLTRERVKRMVTGSTYPNLKVGAYVSALLPIPPLSEQSAIVRFLDRVTRNAGAAISKTHQEIDLLVEYRTRLIADVVTGKLDVREAAASLPEVDPLDVDHSRRKCDTSTSVSPQAADSALPSAHP